MQTFNFNPSQPSPLKKGEGFLYIQENKFLLWKRGAGGVNRKEKILKYITDYKFLSGLNADF